MLTFDEMKKSRLFQELAAEYSREVRLEVRLEGKKLGKLESVLLVLKGRFKRVSAESKAKINCLPESKLDDLLDAICDFKSGRDLTAWLKVNGGDRV
jgi:predicted transposase YdaD